MKDQNWGTTIAGVKMPRIIYGTAWKKERTADLVVQAIRTGFRGIDTACQPKHYNESLVGQALTQLEKEGINRDSLFVQTKFTPYDGQDPNQVPFDENARLEIQVAQSFETSQKNLHTEYVDSLVLHSPLETFARTMTVWRAMETIQKSGGARQLGISNCYDLGLLKQLHAEAINKPAVVQNRFYADTGYDAELREWCSQQGIFYQSFWTLTANPHLLSSPTINKLAKQKERTSAQIFLRALTESGVTPLTGTCSQQHMQENLSIFEFDLTPDEIKEVNQLFRF